MALLLSRRPSPQYCQRLSAAPSVSMPIIPSLLRMPTLRGNAALFGIRLFRDRLEPDYVLRLPQLALEWISTLAQLGKTGSFWQMSIA